MKIRTDLVPVALELVMRIRGNLFASCSRITPPRPSFDMPPEKPITDDYTPAQTLALLQLRGSDLSKAVVAKLRHSTVRASLEAHHELMTTGMIILRGDGVFRLTPYGHHITGALARAMAEQLGIPVPVFTPRSHRFDGFERGVFSQNGNW